MAAKKIDRHSHSIHEHREKALEVAIGREVRALRRKRDITVSELSGATGLSIGMLSKIENGNISSSLTTLQTLASALSVPLTAFFRRFEEARMAVQTKSGEGIDLEREGASESYQYKLLGHIGANASGVIVEPFLITLSNAQDVFPTFQHVGIETIYMLEGEIDYRHGEEIYALKPGDTLFFDTDAPHGPEVLVKFPARYIAVICYPLKG